MTQEKNTAGNEVLYKEWKPISLFVTISISLLIVLLITAIITTSILSPEDKMFTIILCSVLTVFFLLIGINFRGISITITKEDIVVNFGFLNKKKIPIVDLISCEETEATFKKYFGFGVRIGTDSSLGFTTGFGAAVQLKYKDNRPFVFSSKKPQEICQLLESLEKMEK